MLRYITGNGEIVDLDDYAVGNTIWEIFGRTGAAAPPVEFTDETLATGYTETLALRVLPRDLTIPILIRGVSTAHRDQVLRRITQGLIAHGFRRAAGRLMVAAADGRSAYLNCVYSGGLESVSDEDPLIYRATLNFHAADPYWYDDKAQEFLLSDPAQSGLYFGDRFYFGDSTFFLGGLYNDTVQFENEGETVYPVVTVVGPIERLRIEQGGAFFTLIEGFKLEAGEILRIDFRDRTRGIQLTRVGGTTEDVTHFLAPGATLIFPFRSGPNQLKLTYSGTNAETTIKVEYRIKRFSL